MSRAEYDSVSNAIKKDIDKLSALCTYAERALDTSGINTEPIKGAQIDLNNTPTGLFSDLNNVTDETRNTNQTKEEKMTNVLNIEVGATLINNVPSSKFTEDQIIDMIKAENAKIEALKSVTTESVNINGKIEVCQFNIELLIDILDKDEEIVE